MKKLVLIIILSLFTTIGMFAPTLPNKVEKQLEILTEMKINLLKISPFNMDNFYNYLNLVKADHKEIMMKQAILETGNFKSNIFRKNHNLFGMKMPKKRETTAIKEKSGFALYTHWTESINDYLILQQSWKSKRLKIYNDGYEVLKLAGYAQNPEYINLLKKIKIKYYGSITSTESTSIRG